MSVVMIIVEAAIPDIWKIPFAGEYLEAFDPHFPADKGRGLMLTTKDKSKAKQFPSVYEAMNFWRQQSPTLPFRPDGEPNRPLTAFTVTFENVEEL